MTVHTRAWHDRRARSCGASDLPVVLGCSPYSGASSLRLAWQKRGLLHSADEPTGDRITAAVLEQAARSYLAQAMQCEVDYEQHRDDFATVCTACGEVCRHLSGAVGDCKDGYCCDACPTAGHAHANLDGRITYQGRVVNFEGKSISWNNPDYDAWKRKQVPEHVEWQVQQQMLCARLPATVILLFDSPSMRFETRVVEADPERHEFIRKVWATWWQKAIVEGIDPATRWSAVEQAIKARWPDAEPGKEVLFDGRLEDVAHEWVAAKVAERSAKKAAREGRAELLRFMEDASRASLPGGGYLSRTVSVRGAVTLRHHEEIK